MRTFHSIFISLLLSFFLLTACGKQEPSGGNGGEPSGPVEVLPGKDKDLYGQITDSEGNPIKGVVVSDGATSVVTNVDGIYQIKRDPDARFVYYSTPSQYEINVFGNGDWAAKFYEEIPKAAGVHRQDFVLKKREKSVANFNIIAMGDPQVRTATMYKRFTTETMPRLKNIAAGMTDPAVLLILGDINEDNESYMKEMRESLGETGIPVFTTPGNHDKLKAPDQPDAPRNADVYCGNWGPLNYSFNIGSVLFISMDDIRYTNGRDYNAGFTDKQVEWLRQHISFVSDYKMIVMYYHIPLRASGNVQNRAEVMDLLKRFQGIHLMAGHTHWHENYEASNPTRYEHIHAAACGTWWGSQVNTDGTPNGFMLYEVSGYNMKNWHYEPTNGNRDHQMRLHRGNWSYSGNGIVAGYEFQDNALVANVWNADSKWKIEVYENGIYSGEMTRLPSNPLDAWTNALHRCYYDKSAGAVSSCKHLYYYELQDKNAAIEVVARDRFNRRYKESKITTDFTEGKL